VFSMEHDKNDGGERMSEPSDFQIMMTMFGIGVIIIPLGLWLSYFLNSHPEFHGFIKLVVIIGIIVWYIICLVVGYGIGWMVWQCFKKCCVTAISESNYEDRKLVSLAESFIRLDAKVDAHTDAIRILYKKVKK
jgi:hypothetical protein